MFSVSDVKVDQDHILRVVLFSDNILKEKGRTCIYDLSKTSGGILVGPSRLADRFKDVKVTGETIIEAGMVILAQTSI